ncbi:MAG: hypothetical protein B9S32_06925 [Verrucomicrobia bacterium Tous-C9LFEB]|nr:MAG: hypothetical protein B9S32_06925 [Verrucomicrobia bacterium Tous-C9LFEB]
MRKVLLALMLIAATANAAEGYRYISSPGLYEKAVGGENLQVKLDKNTLTLSRVRLKNAVAFEVVDGWLVYTDSSHVLWAYDGYDKIWCFEFTPDSIRFKERHHVEFQWKEAPQQFMSLVRQKRKVSE